MNNIIWGVLAKIVRQAVYSMRLYINILNHLVFMCGTGRNVLESFGCNHNFRKRYNKLYENKRRNSNNQAINCHFARGIKCHLVPSIKLVRLKIFDVGFLVWFVFVVVVAVLLLLVVVVADYSLLILYFHWKINLIRMNCFHSSFSPCISLTAI